MNPFLLALVVAAVSGLLALFCSRFPRAANAVGALGAFSGAAIGLVPTLSTLINREPTSLERLAWSVPYGEFYLHIDALSAWFLAPVFVIAACAAMYGAVYMFNRRETLPVGWAWFVFNLLICSLAIVFTARNSLLFLAAWEIMSLTSFFLVQLDDANARSNEAGRRYFIAMHLGAAVLFVFFILLGSAQGTPPTSAMEFAKGPPIDASAAALLFTLAVIGFGVKAGVAPLHVWAPETYRAAPTFAAALMSGVMAKTGVYGILRTLEVLGPPVEWQAWTLIGVGVASGVIGALNAAAQNDLKRLLAYSSVENMGVIFLGMGVGLLGLSATPSSPVVAVLGFGGALLHVWNDALFKSLLFLAAGVVERSTDETPMDRLGGLLKKAPWLGTCFVIGSIAICGLPPLNGFIGEFLIFLGAFDEGLIARSSGGVVALLVIGGLSITGGFAALCFTKAVGVVFLGAPRSAYPVKPIPGNALLMLPIVLLTLGCFAAGLSAPQFVALLHPVLLSLTAQPEEAITAALASSVDSTSTVVMTSMLLLGATVVVGGLRVGLLAGREVGETETWDCGYAAPTSRMQFTGSGFTQPVVDFFSLLLRPKKQWKPPEGLFPRKASLETQLDDAFETQFYEPLFQRAYRFLGGFGWLQSGQTNVYVMYVAATLLVLLVWFMRSQG